MRAFIAFICILGLLGAANAAPRKCTGLLTYDEGYLFFEKVNSGKYCLVIDNAENFAKITSACKFGNMCSIYGDSRSCQNLGNGCILEITTIIGIMPEKN